MAHFEFTPLYGLHLYNGWRHFYFTYAGIVICAACGVDSLWKLCKPYKLLRIITISALFISFSLTSIGLVENHPYQYTYYNVLLPRNESNQMDMDYWNVSGSGAITTLYEMKKESTGIIRVGCYFNDIKIAALKLPDHIYSTAYLF